MENSSHLEEFCWGTKERIIQAHDEWVDILRIKAGGYSSFHYHHYQDNFMYVIEGQVNIDYGYKIIQLQKGMRAEIFALEKHSFKAVVDSIVLERITPTCIANLSRNDIIRLTERGIEK